MKIRIWKYSMFVLAFVMNNVLWNQYGWKAALLCWLCAAFFSTHTIIELYEEAKEKVESHDKSN